jgi:poly(3-hydroxybutyrate) depolymerase
MDRAWIAPILLLCLGGEAGAAQRLPALRAELTGTTVSGVSSGGYQAVQFHVAHSSLVTGVGVIAAGPYYCARGSAWAARYHCMSPGPWTPLPPLASLVAMTDALARTGGVDATGNLREARVWLFAGRRDATVRPVVVRALRDYYASYVSAERIALVDGMDAGHAMVTADYGGACAVTAPPFVNDCDFDAAGTMLSHLLGPLAPAPSAPRGDLLAFDQREFASGAPFAISMDSEGYLYVPASCRAGACRVHIAFHGCRQGREAIGEVFVRYAGYNRWADSNRLLVLYPQVVARSGWGPWSWPTSFVLNPGGCWDWWGYTGPGYHTRSGAQIRAVRAMLARLAQAE